MRYRTVGKTGLRVSEIGFGCGNNAILMVRASCEEQLRAIRRALDLGINDSVVFGLNKHQGLDRVYYTTAEAGRLTALKDWKKWEK